MSVRDISLDKRGLRLVSESFNRYVPGVRQDSELRLGRGFDGTWQTDFFFKQIIASATFNDLSVGSHAAPGGGEGWDGNWIVATMI